MLNIKFIVITRNYNICGHIYHIALAKAEKSAFNNFTILLSVKQQCLLTEIHQTLNEPLGPTWVGNQTQFLCLPSFYQSILFVLY